MATTVLLTLIFVTIASAFTPETDVFFYLYTRDNTATYQVIEYGNNASIAASYFRLNKPVKIFVPGKGGSPTSPISNKQKDAFLEIDDVNVINVDWRKGSAGTEETVIAAAGPTGKFIAKFIDWLSGLGVKHSDVHLLAISIGSHVIGFAGRNTLKKVSYLTACDPPRNYWNTSDEKVNKGDAQYVEVIHSNTNHHGLLEPIGHVDIYPNWGTVQPGCETSGQNADDCSHMRSYELFVYSLDNKYFQADECKNYSEIVAQKCSNLRKIHLGGLLPKNETGVFYLETGSTPPFYLNNTIVY